MEGLCAARLKVRRPCVAEGGCGWEWYARDGLGLLVDELLRDAHGRDLVGEGPRSLCRRRALLAQE